MNKFNLSESLAKACKSLMLSQPFYGLFLITLNKRWDNNIPTAGVQLEKINFELIINELFWESLEEMHKVGIIWHECLHLAFNHLTSVIFLNRKLGNWAKD